MIISLQLLVNDWVNETFVNHGNYCEHYPVQCHDNVIRLYGYKVATINEDHVVFHECQWTDTKHGSTWSASKDVIIQAADPKFFRKLKRCINKRMKFGTA